MTDRILLAHGSGGKLTHQLIEEIFMKQFDNEMLKLQSDSAVLNINSKKLAFTTDSYVVTPIFFPGGNIGKLAVCGTINDLAVSGARPLYLSASFIIEEGFSVDDLKTIVLSMAEEAQKSGVRVVAGDTKVVEKGKCDQLFITTTGVGELKQELSHISSGKNIQAGDKILINGSVADHGITILSARENLQFEEDIQSDCASLNGLIQKVLDAGINVKFMRDATRGGVATVLAEIARMRKAGIEIKEEAIFIRESIRGLCEVLGYDPLYVANEGKVIMIIDPKDEKKALEIMKQHSLGKESSVIGEICEDHNEFVVLNTCIGGRRILDLLTGEQLPRIC